MYLSVVSTVFALNEWESLTSKLSFRISNSYWGLYCLIPLFCLFIKSSFEMGTSVSYILLSLDNNSISSPLILYLEPVKDSESWPPIIPWK